MIATPLIETSTHARERFCKDCNIPIKIFRDPWFTDRLVLYDPFYGTLSKYDRFVAELRKYANEQDYFEEYNRVKDDAIHDIQSSEHYQRFNQEDMNRYAVSDKTRKLPGKDIFKSTNDGRTFISIDMKKANFSALRHYDTGIFGYARTWEEFIRRYTANEHIVDSKYIRQVILGNCNPKRHITYEKYLMDGVLDKIADDVIPLEKVAFFSNDEIVFDVTGIAPYNMETLYERIKRDVDGFEGIPLRVEMFVLHKIPNTQGYYKSIFNPDGKPKIEFKCLDNYVLPFVMRAILKQPVTESDRTFYHEGRLARFIEIPDVESDYQGMEV